MRGIIANRLRIDYAKEIERADSGIRSFVSVQGALCMYPTFGNTRHRSLKTTTYQRWPPNGSAVLD